MNRNHKILIVCPEFYPRQTGYSHAFQNLTRVLIRNGFDVDILTTTPLGVYQELSQKNLSIIRLKTTNLKIIRFFARQYQIAQKISELDSKADYSCVLVETFSEPIMHLFIKDNIMSKIIVRIHGCYETERRFFYPGFINSVSRILCRFTAKSKVKNFASTNPYHISFIKKHFLSDNLYSALNKNFFLIPNALPEQHTQSNSNNPCNEEYFLTLGRMDESGYNQKGIQDIVTAVYIARQTHNIHLRLKIIGDGSHAKKIDKLVTKLDLTDLVERIPSLQHTDVLNEVCQSKAVVLASRYEGLSMFALEALSLSKPVIFTTGTGLDGLCIEGQNGYTFEPRNVSELALKMVNIYNLSKSEVDKLGCNSRSLVQKNFSDQNIIDIIKLAIATLKA